MSHKKEQRTMNQALDIFLGDEIITMTMPVVVESAMDDEEARALRKQKKKQKKKQKQKEKRAGLKIVKDE